MLCVCAWINVVSSSSSSFANTRCIPFLVDAETWTSLSSIYSKLWISLATWGTATSLAKVETTALFHSSKRIHRKVAYTCLKLLAMLVITSIDIGSNERVSSCIESRNVRHLLLTQWAIEHVLVWFSPTGYSYSLRPCPLPFYAAAAAQLENRMNDARSPRSRMASWISLVIMVTRLAWMAQRFMSSKTPTRYASEASWRAMRAVLWNEQVRSQEWKPRYLSQFRARIVGTAPWRARGLSTFDSDESLEATRRIKW